MLERFVAGSQVRTLHCAATVMPQMRDKSDLQQPDIPEQEMKNKFILIGAVSVVILATIFSYVSWEKVSVQTGSIQTATNAVFKVGEKTYSVDIAAGETVIDAMRTLASTTDFTYTSRDYPGLGVFVDSIDGIKNAGGMYWILSVNGATSASGVSATTLKTGDVIEWKYEKGF